MVKPNYFTCTLGQAARLPKDQDRNFDNINDFVDKQARRVPHLPAVGFYTPSIGTNISWTSHVLTFSDIFRGSCFVSEILSSKIPLRKRQTVALLCPSTAEFLFVWLALMRLGHPVLLLAPQCSSSAIAHLCRTCEVEQLFYDEVYEDLASTSNKAFSLEDGSLCCSSIQSFLSKNIYETIKEKPTGAPLDEENSENDVAYLHHTSGTSSGTPKPVPQTHRAGLGVLPTLEGRNEATFTTTPLYHGGIADLFRAWTSDAMIWLFPGKRVPITPTNIIHCLQAAHDSHLSQGTPQVRYFSSVPYILQMMAADNVSIAMLQEMNIVGVGGAALPVEIGDQLVEQNINLISRFGSAECGFLMSSHREYAKDQDWQYLRPGDQISTTCFEKRDGGVSELIVLPGWPHMAKQNREDGSYATADLFEPHPSTENAWRYHSRADSQLTLITGKKFDPAPLEDTIAASNFLQGVLIFGDGKPYPGAFLFRSETAKEVSDEELIAQLKLVIDMVNVESQSHVQLVRNMLVPMPFMDQPLEKSSKGTILRRKAETRYAAEIEQAYTKLSLRNGGYVEDDQVSSTIQEVVASVVGRGADLTISTDLFSYGVDSVACVQIRHALIQLLPEENQDIPLTVVEDCGSISKLTELIISRRHGRSYDEEDQQQLMIDLVKKHAKFSDPPKANSDIVSIGSSENCSGEVILLTGATGALGAHILHLYLASPNISQIICLVRGASQYAATKRVSKALSSRKLSPLTPKVTILWSDSSLPSLGLDDLTYNLLAKTVTTIHHVAWVVNFRLSLSSFSGNLASARNLLNLALSSPHKEPPNFIFCSSVASIMNSPPGMSVPEAISNNVNDCGPLGYSRSKWIAEAICHAAHRSTRLHGRIAVMRVGQLSGATDTGIWNMREAYPMMLSQVSLTNRLPDMKDEPLTWLPVDSAARAFVEVAEGMRKRVTEEMQVYHVVNIDQTAQWQDLLAWVRKIHPKIEAVPPQVFVERLEELQREGSHHPAMKLIPHWKAAYKSNSGKDTDVKQQQEQNKKRTPQLQFEMQKTYTAARTLKGVPPVNEVYFGKIWRWVQEQDQEGISSAAGDKE